MLLAKAEAEVGSSAISEVLSADHGTHSCPLKGSPSGWLMLRCGRQTGLVLQAKKAADKKSAAAELDLAELRNRIASSGATQVPIQKLHRL